MHPTRYATLALCLLLLTACGDSPTPTTSAPTVGLEAVADAGMEESLAETARINAWFDEQNEERLTFSPIELTMLGRKTQYDEIDQMPIEAQREYLDWFAASVASLNDMQAYIARIGGIARALGQQLDWAQTNAERGVRPPRFAYELVIDEAEGLLDGAPFTDSGSDAPLWADARAKIHQIGLQEVERLRAEMEAIKDEVGFEGSLQEFFRYINTDERFFYPNIDEGRQQFLADSEAYLNDIKDMLPEYFGILPRAELVVRRVEAFREQDGAPAHYYPSSEDGSIPGVYYAHLSDMTANPTWDMEAVAYHEGLPGHHMQIAIAQELEAVPDFRGQFFFTAYTEGWGLYSEQLAWEMGQYEDPYSNFGRLTAEMWRAVRPVVDTGLHAMGWSEQQAIDFFSENAATPLPSIIAEVRRYLVIPGQATSYKIGMLKILELRERAQSGLGDAFDIRDFHDVVLSGGALPLEILERRVNNYIDLAGRGEEFL